MVPLIVKRLVEFVELNGLDVEGVYRISADADIMAAFKSRWDVDGVDPLPSTGTRSDDEQLVHASCGLLKVLYILPLSIICVIYSTSYVCT